VDLELASHHFGGDVVWKQELDAREAGVGGRGEPIQERPLRKQEAAVGGEPAA
jgi:hypothetical protein